MNWKELFLNGSWSYPDPTPTVALALTIMLTLAVECGIIISFYDKGYSKRVMAAIIILSNVATACLGFLIKTVLG